MVDYVKPRKDYKYNESIHDYVYRVGNKYEIKKGKQYYGRYFTRDDAKKVSLELKKLGWDKSNLKEAQKNANVRPSDKYHRNSSGYIHVTKQKDDRMNQRFMWVYSYRDGDKRKRITCKTIKGLEEKVKDKGLEWEKL